MAKLVTRAIRMHNYIIGRMEGREVKGEIEVRSLTPLSDRKVREKAVEAGFQDDSSLCVRHEVIEKQYSMTVEDFIENSLENNA